MSGRCPDMLARPPAQKVCPNAPCQGADLTCSLDHLRRKCARLHPHCEIANLAAPAPLELDPSQPMQTEVIVGSLEAAPCARVPLSAAVLRRPNEGPLIPTSATPAVLRPETCYAPLCAVCCRVRKQLGQQVARMQLQNKGSFLPATSREPPYGGCVGIGCHGSSRRKP